MATTIKPDALDKSITDAILNGQALLKGLLELAPEQAKTAAVIRELEGKLAVVETDNSRLRSERDHFKRKLNTLEERVRGEIGVVRSAALLNLQPEPTGDNNNNNTHMDTDDATVISGPIESTPAKKEEAKQKKQRKTHHVPETDDSSKPKKTDRIYAPAYTPRKTPLLLADKICPTCFKTIAKGEVSSAWVNHTKKCRLGLSESY